ncbi:MAG: hypothetical protein ABIO81_04140 [Ginsengibacter sp.]
MKKIFLPNLSLCILLDLIGMSSYLLPFIGEAEDFLWAPISGIIFYFMFGKKMGALGGFFSFLEEISPGLDFIPTFTISWFIKKNELKKHQIKSRSLQVNDSSVNKPHYFK